MSIRILNDLFVHGTVSANGGNSIEWNSTHSTVATNSANWAAQSLSAYVIGPLSSVDSSLVEFDGASGKLIKSSNIKKNHLFDLYSTGLLSGGKINMVADPTKFSISNGHGIIADTWTNINSPSIYEVTWTGLSSLSTPFLSTASFTHVFINSSGNVVTQNTDPTPQNYRDYIYLGQVAHTNLSSVNTTQSTPIPFVSPNLNVYDLQRAIGIINTGNSISSNGANLQLNKSSGSIEFMGVNFDSDIKSPNIKVIDAASAFTFRHRTQTGNGSSSNILDVGNYDSGGTITPFVGTKSQNFRVFLTTAGNVVIQYGQNEYNSLTSAIAAIQSESFVVYPNLSQNATLIGIISVESNTTSLADTNKCKFFNVSKFGEVVGANAGTSVTTLQNAYNNSTNPEILTNATHNAISFRRGSNDDSDAVFHIENGAGTPTFTVSGNGAVTTNASFYTQSGNSIQWNTSYNTTNINSGNWSVAYTNLVSNSAAYLTSTDITYLGSLSSGWESTKNTVNANSAVIWNYQGTDIKALTSNWQISYTNLISNSAAYLSSPDITYIASLSAGWENTRTTVANNSAIWALSGGGGGSETDPIFTTWAQANSANYQSTYTTVGSNSSTWGGGGGGGQYNWELLSTVSITAPVASINVIGMTGHSRYKLDFRDIVPVLNGYILQMRMSNNNGVSFAAGASDYSWCYSGYGIYFPTRSVESFCKLSYLTKNSIGNGTNGYIYFIDPNDAATPATYTSDFLETVFSSNDMQGLHGGGKMIAASAINALQFFFSVGNLSAGVIKIYGWNE